MQVEVVAIMFGMGFLGGAGMRVLLKKRSVVVGLN